VTVENTTRNAVNFNKNVRPSYEEQLDVDSNHGTIETAKLTETRFKTDHLPPISTRDSNDVRQVTAVKSKTGSSGQRSTSTRRQANTMNIQELDKSADATPKTDLGDFETLQKQMNFQQIEATAQIKR